MTDNTRNRLYARAPWFAAWVTLALWVLFGWLFVQ